LDIHLIVPFRVIRAAAPHLREPAKKEREEGREVFRKIVNVSSISGTMGNAGQANYSSAKAAIVGLTKTLAKEWGQLKVNCNAVAPAAASAWAPASSAPIHPGVQTITADGQCTANFVYTEGTDVYIGQAAHCSRTGAATDSDGCSSASLPIGTSVTVGGASRP